MNIVVLASMALLMAPHASSDASAFSYTGEYVEGCSCMGTCPCELTGVAMGCQGVGLFHASRATYGDKDLGEFKAAYALEPGKWVVLYIDAPADKVDGVTAFMKGALSAFGPVESVKSAQIDYKGDGGENVVTVDGAKIMSFTCEPVMGGDGKSPLVYNNIHDALHPSIMQGKTDSCTFKDGSHEFTLKGSNAYFNDHIDSSGKF